MLWVIGHLILETYMISHHLLPIVLVLWLWRAVVRMCMYACGSLFTHECVGIKNTASACEFKKYEKT